MIKRVAAADVRPLRRAVLRPGLPPQHSVYPQDDTAVHLAAYDDADRLVGCVTIFAEPYPDHPDAWRLRGMATDPSVRGSGVGAALLFAAEDAARAAGAPLLWCHARVSATGFYARHGWRVVGQEFLEPDTRLPHRVMRKSLG